MDERNDWENLRKQANAKTSNDTTNNHHRESSSECLNSTTDSEDASTNEEGSPSAYDVSHTTSGHRRNWGCGLD